jgi:hypothetical protein
MFGQLDFGKGASALLTRPQRSDHFDASLATDHGAQRGSHMHWNIFANGSSHELRIYRTRIARVERAIGSENHELAISQCACYFIGLRQQATDTAEQRTEWNRVGATHKTHRPMQCLA